MLYPLVKDGADSLQIWKVAANILNKQSQPTRGGPPAWRLGKELTTPHHTKLACYGMLYRASDLDEFFGTTYTGENGYEIWNMEC
jgi:glycine cleavage system aminomethyltransferase T